MTFFVKSMYFHLTFSENRVRAGLIRLIQANEPRISFLYIKIRIVCSRVHKASVNIKGDISCSMYSIWSTAAPAYLHVLLIEHANTWCIPILIVENLQMSFHCTFMEQTIWKTYQNFVNWTPQQMQSTQLNFLDHHNN